MLLETLKTTAAEPDLIQIVVGQTHIPGFFPQELRYPVKLRRRRDRNTESLPYSGEPLRASAANAWLPAKYDFNPPITRLSPYR